MNVGLMSCAYEEGVERFLEFAFERSWPNEDVNYFCPCINYLNKRRQLLDDIQEHLFFDEIKKNYTTWIWHGEFTNMQRESEYEPIDVQMGDRLEEMIRDLG